MSNPSTEPPPAPEVIHMPHLTDVDEIALLVSAVTEVMCGATFAPWDPMARGESLSGRMVVLPMEGPRRIHIALACDSRGSRALASSMFGCPPAEVTPRQIDDAIRELLNVVAGQVQRKLKIDQPLGTPRPTNLAEMSEAAGVGIGDAVLLRSQGNVDIRLWIFEQAAAPSVDSAAVASRGMFRSLIKRLVPRA